MLHYFDRMCKLFVIAITIVIYKYLLTSRINHCCYYRAIE